MQFFGNTKQIILDPERPLISRTDMNGNIISANDYFVETSGFEKNELLGHNHNIIRHRDMPREVFEDLWKTIKKGSPWLGAIKNKSKNGNYYWVMASISPFYKNGKVVGYMSLRNACSEKQIRDAEIIYQKLIKGEVSLNNGAVYQRKWGWLRLLKSFDYLNFMILLIIVIQGIFIFNSSFEAGYEQIIFISLILLLMSILTIKFDYRRVLQLEDVLKNISGSNFHSDVALQTPVLLNGLSEKIKSIRIQLDADSSDLKETIKKAEVYKSKLEKLAYTDSLTQLANRTAFIENLDKLIQLKRTEFALFFIDLDNFKYVNDYYGHDVGDKVLEEVSERLIEISTVYNDQDSLEKSCPTESCDLARLGGDEFTFIIRKESLLMDVDTIAKHMVDSVSLPIHYDGNELHLSVSIGVACYNTHITRQELMKRADLAMYLAKSEGKNCFRHFDDELEQKLSRKKSIESGLRNAIEQGELHLVYQPQLDIASNKLSGVESLLRWNSSKLGNVSPAEFIPVAEDSNLIIPIGLLVLKQAFIQEKVWSNNSFYFKYIAVNLSLIQLLDPMFIPKVKALIDETGVEPNRIEIEITERVLLKNTETMIGKLCELKKLGFRLSIDDFGTGYSSMAYLKNMPIDKIKIDRSFVQDLTTDKNDQAIVGAICSMAMNLGLETIAEGVETKEQYLYLKEVPVQKIQGYLYSKPLSVTDLCNPLVFQSDLLM
ncbi:MAG: EAL domain-containing protein [Pseudomonadota bacterium]|nr:EAL domain-containing protein [Pseudomonadota bacterium]